MVGAGAEARAEGGAEPHADGGGEGRAADATTAAAGAAAEGEGQGAGASASAKSGAALMEALQGRLSGITDESIQVKRWKIYGEMFRLAN